MAEVGESEKIENVSYFDHGGGYKSVYTFQKSLNCTLRCVHFITCTSMKKISWVSYLLYLKKQCMQFGRP